MMDFSCGCSNCWNGCSFSVTSLDTPAAFILCVAYFIRFRTVVISVYLVSKLALLTIIIVNLIEHLQSKSTHFSNANPLRNTPGAMFLAISAASIGIVPEPHPGSIRSHSPRHPVIRSIPAANTSFSGHLPVPGGIRDDEATLGRVQRQRTSGMCNMDIEQHIRLLIRTDGRLPVFSRK